MRRGRRTKIKSSDGTLPLCVTTRSLKNVENFSSLVNPLPEGMDYKLVLIYFSESEYVLIPSPKRVF